MSEGYTGCSQRDTRGASSSGQMDKNEAWRGTKEYEREKDKGAIVATGDAKIGQTTNRRSST